MYYNAYATDSNVLAISLIFRFFLSFIPAIIADKKGRNCALYFVLSLITSPLIMLIFVLCLSRKKTDDVNRSQKPGSAGINCTSESTTVGKEPYPLYIGETAADEKALQTHKKDVFCKTCGAKLIEGSNYCNNCGTRV